VRASTARVWRVARGPLSLLAWLYLCVVVSLGLWVYGTRVVLGWSPTIVTSGSMAPRINSGDVILLASPTDDTLTPGAVVAFRPSHGSGLVVHRLLRINGDGSLATRGDANPAADVGTITRSDVVGVGRLLVPVLGTPVAWATTGHRVAATALLAGTALAAGLVAVPARRRRRPEERRP
jgi:signal peptidase I